MKYVFAVFLLALFGNQSAAIAKEPTKPNLVLVMADDIGLGDIGFYHQLSTGKQPVVATPNIDELVKTGMRFSDAHSPASLCAPSRYSMLTGNYPFRSGKINGVWTPHAKSGIEPNATTIARIAKAGGYNTAFFGKWGLGESWLKQKYDYQKLDRGALYFGFDFALELPDGIQNSPLAFYLQQQFMPINLASQITEIPLKQTQFTGKGGRTLAAKMLGDSYWNPMLAGPIIANSAVRYIEQQNKTKPFFIYYSTQAVHIPHTPPIELDGVKIKGATPSSFGDMILELDVQVGMLIKALKKQGLYENTLFVFTSDNGGLPNKYAKELMQLGHASNLNLRGNKGAVYEGGHRVPFIAAWPDKIPANSESKALIVGLDMVATIAALSGQKIDPSLTKDSLNLLPIFTNTQASEQRLYISHQSKSGPYFAIRQGSWKLIMKTSSVNNLKDLQPYALYNLKENITENESGNLIADPKQVSRIQTLFNLYLEHRTSGNPSVISVD
ncbi:hypothetical protein XM47_01025 [Catenovulum maritimum]|uniref:Sulfatase N-terminal domain-containing protein n=2 Tax=Catenovulum maritimum TaxID=1513271 RepID=A0A0J8H142_9ALTE|nr:hypothetical protein XM47_01025 [Catenovulum maritimum]